MAEHLVYFNGQIVSSADVRISISDAGFLHGASAFTTMLARDGVVFRLSSHIDRLLATVQKIHLRTDATAQSLADGVKQLLAATELQSARVRITLTPGDVHADDNQPTVLITAHPFPPPPQQWYEKGISACISSQRQMIGDVAYGSKTGCYLQRMLARQEAATKGCDEAIWFTTDQRLAESCFSNIFVVRGGKVLTPSLDTPVLPGIIRQAVIEICAELKIDCDEAAVISAEDMFAADEIFITSSCSGIRPVVLVERQPIGDGKVGVITKRIMEAYEKMLVKECSAA